MGNRAVITTSKYLEPKNSTELGVYLHWNGGYDSVEAFLTYCKLKGYRPPETDCYGWARLCQVIGNFFGGDLSIGIDQCCKLDCDNWDNGTYIIENWKIVDRKYKHGLEQHNYDLTEMLIAIDEAQPTKEQIGKEFFTATEVATNDLKVGDVVYLFDNIYSRYEKHTVVGIGTGKPVNGTGMYGTPYVDRYGDEERGYEWNPNNYITTKTIRVCR